MKKSYKKFNYSLVEMLAVIAIIGILLAVTIPGFMRAIKGNELLRAGNTLSAALQKARAEAIISRQAASVIFHEDRDRQYIGVRYYSRSESSTIIKWYPIDKDIKIAKVAKAGSNPLSGSWLSPYSYSNCFGAVDEEGNKLLAPEDIEWKRKGSTTEMRTLTFSSTGKLKSANNLYFGVVNTLEIPTSEDVCPSESAKLELNHFTGEVKWLQ